MKLDKAHLDFETRSKTDLNKSGVYRYAEDPTTGVWCFSYRFDSWPKGHKKQWRPGYPDPVDLLDYIELGGMVAAHNASFERVIWNMVLRKHYPHWPPLIVEQQDCTMARAAAVSYPQKLDTLGRVLNTDTKKDLEGYFLMMKMCRPRGFYPDGTVKWWDAPELVDRLNDYCDADVLTECDIDEIIPPLTDYERLVWEFDQKINDRGIPIDVKAVKKCVTLVELAKKSADLEMRRLTKREVPKCSNDAKMIKWIQAQGIDCTTMRKDKHDDIIFLADLNSRPDVKEAIELRSDAKKTSTAKYAAMTACVSSDDRIRGTLNYHGAGPGRWAGRGIQPQNFPRVNHEKEAATFNWIFEMLDSDMEAKEVFDSLVMMYGESGPNAPLRLMSRMLRATIKAPEGFKLVGGDFANIEGRINAWEAGEQWKLDAFTAYDRGEGSDLYNIAYARSFGVALETVDDSQRQIGKVQELALGYQGGVGAYMTMGQTYGVNPYSLAPPVQAAASAQQWDYTAAQYQTTKDKHGLQEREWTALKILVDNWRKANPAIVQSWWTLQDAALEAMAASHRVVTVLGGKVQYYYDERALWCVLPSGRMICYASPRIHTSVVEYVDKFTGETKERTKHSVVFWGFKDGQWKEGVLYGGLQCENIVQGTARDVMVDRMFAVEAAGYPVILTVHDEIMSEVRKGIPGLNATNFKNIMSVVPPWAAGLPLTAKAWEDERYVK